MRNVEMVMDHPTGKYAHQRGWRKFVAPHKVDFWEGRGMRVVGRHFIHIDKKTSQPVAPGFVVPDGKLPPDLPKGARIEPLEPADLSWMLTPEGMEQNKLSKADLAKLPKGN